MEISSLIKIGIKQKLSWPFRRILFIMVVQVEYGYSTLCLHNTLVSFYLSSRSTSFEIFNWEFLTFFGIISFSQFTLPNLRIQLKEQVVGIISVKWFCTP